MKAKRLLKKILVVEFRIGVNCIGLPMFHKHKIAQYKHQSY